MKISMAYIKLIFLCALFYSVSANSIERCPDDPVRFETEVIAKKTIQALNPLVVNDSATDSCFPKTTNHMAIGQPLCMFNSVIPAQLVSSMAIQETGKTIAYTYLFEYSPDGHKKLHEILNSRYPFVPLPDYPERLKSMPIHHEVTSLFRRKDFYISLNKPSIGMPEPWHSMVVFEKEKYIDISRRNLNLCN